MRVKILNFSPRSASWLKYDAVITPENPLMYTCFVCGKTSGDMGTGHEVKCRAMLMNQLGIGLTEEEVIEKENPFLADAIQAKLNEIAFGKEEEDADQERSKIDLADG